MIETRYAFIGNVDSGKSTLLSVLSTGDLDDGRKKCVNTLVNIVMN